MECLVSASRALLHSGTGQSISEIVHQPFQVHVHSFSVVSCTKQDKYSSRILFYFLFFIFFFFFGFAIGRDYKYPRGYLAWCPDIKLSQNRTDITHGPRLKPHPDYDYTESLL